MRADDLRCRSCSGDVAALRQNSVRRAGPPRTQAMARRPGTSIRCKSRPSRLTRMKASSSKEATHTFLVIEANAIWGFHNIGASQPVNDHVVDRTCSDPRQVCVERKLAV